jgi:ABC-type branched-subunit amino acid transport system ATPase component
LTEIVRTSEKTAALRARDISVSFGGLRALDDVSVIVAPGEVVGVLGPNGAGKTTLLDCLSGFVPCRGRIWVGAREVTGFVPHLRAGAGLGRSFQDARLFHTMTVLDTLRVACELKMQSADVISTLLSLPPSRTAERAALHSALEMVEMMGLAAYRDKLIKELSTGTRRIVDLACILIQRPAVVLLDEPSSGIAQRETEALGPLLLDVRDRLGCAMVLVEHDMPLLLGVAERVYALETGRVIAVGKPDDVVRHPEVVRSYLGDDHIAIKRSGAR